MLIALPVNSLSSIGQMPDKLLFTNPQYNTWIETGLQSEPRDIMTYAKSILANGFRWCADD